MLFKIITMMAALIAPAGGALQAQPSSDELLYRQLAVGGKEVALAALNQIVKTPEAISATVLYSSLGVAVREKRLEDSGFIFYIARFRAQFDKELFPPVGQDGDSPLVALSALQQQWGGVINPALMTNPKSFAAVLARVKAWNPKIPENYHPGWEYTAKGSEAQAAGVMEGSRRQFLEAMNGLCTLLQDDAYYNAFRVCQNYNMKRGEDRPPKSMFEAAMQTMERIEKEKGLPGIASQNKK